MSSIYEVLRLQALQLLEVIPAILKAAVVFIIGLILAKILMNGILRLLAALGVDRLAERIMSAEFFAANNIKLVPSRIISGFVYYFMLIIFTMAAVEALGMRIISDLMADFIDYIPHAVTAFVILLFGIYVADAIKKVVLSACRSLGITSGNLIANVIFYFIFLNIILIALRQARLQTTFMETNISIMLAGAAGAFAIGYGLAARDIMGNMLAGFYNRNRIRVGDEVTINRQRGEVILMGSTSLTLRSEDSEIIVPFSKLSSEGVEIHSRRASGPPLPPNADPGA